jgi:halocyanin-like protein
MTDISRRNFLRAAGAGAGLAGATGAASAQEGEGGGGGGGGTAIDWGGYLEENAANWAGPDSTVDATGQSEVTIEVGPTGVNNGNAFVPAGIVVDPGTTIVWEWANGGHNIIPDGSPEGASFEGVESLLGGGETHEETFETDGIYRYFCSPHSNLGMYGAVAVGDAPTRSLNQATPPPIVDESSRTLGVATFIAMVSTLGLAYFFMKYGGDYEE